MNYIIVILQIQLHSVNISKFSFTASAPKKQHSLSYDYITQHLTPSR